MIKYLLFINALGFIICLFDKILAIRHEFRVSEKTLILISFLGGCFGFYLSMIIFHHKTNKKKFDKYIYLSIILWIIALGGICYEFTR